MTSRERSTGNLNRYPARKRRAKVRGSFSPDDAGDLFLDLPKNVGWGENASLTEIRFKDRGHDWQGYVKAERGKEKLIAFVNAKRFEDCVLALSDWAAHGVLNWRKDRPPPWK